MLYFTFPTILIYSRIIVSFADVAVSFRAAGSCSGRCGSHLDTSQPCQCNSHCLNFGDCCSDYNALCVTSSSGTGASCMTLTQVSEQLWRDDVNRLPTSAYSMNYQSQVAGNSLVDQASQNLFSHINNYYLSGPTYSTFIHLMDNYQPSKGQQEVVTSQERQEEDAFLEAILSTRIMNTLLNFLTCEGIVTSRAELKSTLRTIWFDLYPRSGSSTTPDTNGFEHVLVGEYKSDTEVNGFHNWVSFYEKEQSGELDYYGYVFRDSTAPMIGAAFNWNNRMKALGSFFIGVSPEFDMAIYSLCFLTNPNRSCSISLNGKQYSIMSYDKDGHIATAFASTA